MNLTAIAVSTRVCTDSETKVLSLWSASFLPLCQMWAAKRELHPPLDVIATLQKIRFDTPSLSGSMLDPLDSVSLGTGQREPHPRYESTLEKVVTDLMYDLNRLQALISHGDSDNRQQSFLTTARDLRRFQRAIAQLQLTQIEIVASEPIITTLFSPRSVRLYIPLWPIDSLPRTMFEPDQSFYRARPASLAWLLLDAIVISADGKFKTL